MKSSLSNSRVLDKDAANKMLSWQPEEFVVPHAHSAQVTPEDIRALFQPSAEQLENGYISQDHPSAICPAGTKRVITPWTPEKIEWVPPFQDKYWVPIKENLAAERANVADEDFNLNIGIAAQENAETILKEARKRAEEIILQAQQTADETLTQAEEESEQLKKQAYDKGYGQGISDLQTVLESARGIVQQTTAWQNDLYSQSESMILSIVRQVAQVMFGEGVQLDNEALQRNLNRVLENAKSIGDVRIYLNPKDARILDPSWRKFQASITGIQVQIIPSESILPGGCYVEGQMGSVDGRVETELKTVLEALNPETQSDEENS